MKKNIFRNSNFNSEILEKIYTIIFEKRCIYTIYHHGGNVRKTFRNKTILRS